MGLTMTFECPSCKKQGFIDDIKVPVGGIYANCPDCGTKFKISKPSDFTFESETPAEEQTKTFVPPICDNSSSKQPRTAIKPVEVPIYKKINPKICGISTLGAYTLFILSFFVSNQEQLFAALILASGLVAMIGFVYSLISLGRCWAILQGTTARTTVNKAISFLFIPFFNLYWMFIAYAGLANDANKYADQQKLTRRISYGLAITVCISTLIPFLNLFTLIISTILVYQTAEFNNEIINKWNSLTVRPDNKNDGSPALVIALSVLVGIALLGVITAVAIPQFSNYREKARLSSESPLGKSQEQLPQQQQPGVVQQDLSAQIHDNLEQSTVYPLEPFVVQIYDGQNLCYMKVKIELEMSGSAIKTELDRQLATIRDAILVSLTTKTLQDVQDAQGKNQLREEILSAIIKIIAQGKVTKVYFTEFAVQHADKHSNKKDKWE